MLKHYEIEVRVRYPETDPMGFLHHSNYFVYFEMARIELLRSAGHAYRRMEEEGLYFVVAKTTCRFHQPARYDDLLTVRIEVVRATAGRIEHEYEVLRDGQTLATCELTLAALSADGKICRVPEWLRDEDNQVSG